MADELNFEDLRSYEGFPYVSFIESNIRKNLLKKMESESRIRPMTSWIKMTSGVQRIEGEQKDFITMVGISKFNSEKHTLFGFEDVYKESDQYRPRPGITQITSQYKTQYGGVRSISVDWVVNSKDQLEEFGPYFLTPGRSVIVEWGWLNEGELFILPTSEYDNLNPYKHKQWLAFLERSIRSGGNYEGSLGIITNFEFSLNEDGGFNCTTEIMNQGALMYGLNLVQQIEVKPKIINLPGPLQSPLGGPLQVNTLSNEDLVKFKYKRVIKQFVERDLPEIVKNFTDLDNQTRSKDVHVYIDQSEKKHKNKYIASQFGPSSVSSSPNENDNTLGNNKIFVTWGFIEDIIVNQHLGAQFAESEDGQIFRISSKETFPPEAKQKQSDEKPINSVIIKEEIKTKNDQSNKSKTIYSNFYNNRRNSYQISNHKCLRSTNLSVCYINNGETANEVFGIKFDTPTLDDTEKNDKSSVGYVRHIYVNLDVVANAFLNADTLSDALMSILNQINSACITFWNLKLKIKETTQEMCVIDENYFDEKISDIIKSDIDKRFEKVFLFKMFGGNGFIINNNFSTKLSNSVAMTTMYGMNKDENDPIQLNTDNDSFINLWDRFNYKDFFLKTKYDLQSLGGSPVYDDSSPKDKDQEIRDDLLHESPDNNGFSREFKEAMLPLKEWKSIGENDLVNAMKKIIYSGGEKSSKHEIVLPADLEITIEGTSGLRIGDLFYVDSVPNMYLRNAIFQIKGIDDTISGNFWTTKIRGLLRVFDFENPGTNIKSNETSKNTIKELQNKRWTGAPKKQVLQWIKREMGSILASKTSGTIYSESLLAGIIYAETSGIIDVDKDAKTNCSNIRNRDGKGYSHSIFQINDKANGTYINDRLNAGDWKNPSSATDLAIWILNEKKSVFQKEGLKGDELLKACVNSYNQGQGNVLNNIRSGFSIDYNSFNPDYVSKVFTAKEEYEKL